MREAGRIVAFAVRKAFDALEQGITTRELDDITRRAIESEGAKPGFLGLYGFPATACISINEEIVHGIPGDRVVQAGDLVTLDCGAIVGGYNSDYAVTQVAGLSTSEKDDLIETTRGSLEMGIKRALPGNRVGDISNAIESHVLPNAYELVREYVGHGIGKDLHEPPQIPNFGPAGHGLELKTGMVLAIEPMVNVGGWKARMLDDGWTVVTEDGALSCHFEHTVAVTEDGPVVLTVE
ncbi:MAG TPA: type I methionyl aminopeptidase [Dehalococcoidia bacterium]|nr:type I methionyl aminopeptidase [Dehalococcoidia bacterium]HIK89243.1 type I methionyl aminopeptidase [Dehalococcoidia bacterium]